MTILCVPYYNSNVASQYRLYSVAFEKKDMLPNWNANGLENEQSIAPKFRGLQDYFEKRYYTHKYPGRFQVEALDKHFSAKDKYQIALNEQTPSVFLGLFLKAAEQIQRYEFNSEWQIICVTGDVKYDKETGKMSLVSVSEIDKKFSGEFVSQADNNKQEQYLFLYINENQVVPEGKKQGKHGNITVKQFSPDKKISDIIDYIFKPITLEFDFSKFETKQQTLLRIMENENGVDFGYIPGEGFDDFVDTMMYDPKWQGFFIHGEGGSGKSAAAMAIARYLTRVNKIYAPVWIRINNDEINRLIEEETQKDVSNIIPESRPIERDIQRNVSNITLESRIFGEEPQEDFSSITIEPRLIEKDMQKNIAITTQELRDKVEKHIISRIESRVEQTKESLNRYLVVIDNLELRDDYISRILLALKKLSSDLDTKLNLIITSRIMCSNSHYIEELHLQEERPPKLTRDKLAVFIENIAKRKGKIYERKIEEAKNKNTFLPLVEILFQRIGDFPDLIFSVIELLQYMSVTELSGEMNAKLGGNEKIIRNKRKMIYMFLFPYLNILQKQVLYLFLVIGEGIPASIDDLLEKINKLKLWKNKSLKYSELKETLRVLLNHNLIYSMENEGKTFYGIKSVPYFTFLFEEEFQHSTPKEKDFLRDAIIDLGLQLRKAIEYDQDAEIITSILNKMKKKKMSISGDFGFLAAQYSSKAEILSLLKNFGCNFNTRDEYGYDNIFFRAVKFNKNTAIFDWLLEHVPELLDCKGNNGMTVFHFAVDYGNIAALDWLIVHASRLLSCKDNYGKTVFHYAARYNNVAALDWLLTHAPTLLSCKDNDGCTVFHYAAAAGGVAELDWLMAHAPELLGCKDNKGRTVFHSAARYGNFITFDWLMAHVPELLDCKDNNGLTVFHEALDFGNAVAVDWLLKHATELLSCKTNDELTVFHYAVANGNITTLDWLLVHTPELLGCKDKFGATVFHYAAFYSNATTLDWLFKHTPKLLDCKDNNGKTVFHVATRYGNAATMGWLFEHTPKLLDCKDNNGMTVFHYAAYYGSTVAMDWLLEHAPELLSLKDNNGLTVFHHAADQGNSDAFNWLLTHAPELLSCKSNDEKTVFHYAASRSNVVILDCLFEQAFDLLACRDNIGATVFHHAAAFGSVVGLDWLLAHAPELLNCKTYEGRTVFHSAARYSNIIAFDWLMAHIPELLSCSDNNGWTVFHNAAAFGKVVGLDWLFAHVPELLNFKDNEGHTVFHAAAANKNIEVLEWLFKRIPELLNCKDNNGKTVYHHAKEKNNTAVLDWLSANAPELCK